MNTGTYEETLPCGGNLKVTKTYWEISYYFPGPDMRYKGTFVSIPGTSVEQYISAFKENLEEYENLKSSIPKGGEFSKIGKFGMSIHIGNRYQGVCLRSYYIPISSSQDLQKRIDSYRQATRRAAQIQQFLASI